MAGLLLAGNLMLDRYSNGERQNYFIGPLNATAIEINPGEAERVQRKSYMRDTYGQNLDSVVLPGAPSISITLDDASPEIIAFALLGTTASISQASGSVADEEVTIVALDKWHKLNAHQISSVVVKDDDGAGAAGTTTYVLGTDYDLDLATGAIKALTGGAIEAADLLHVAYTKAATTGTRVTGSQENDVTAWLRLDGTNLATGKPVQGVIYKAVLAPSGTINLGGDEFVSFGLEGDLVTPDGYSAPYVIDFLD